MFALLLSELSFNKCHTAGGYINVSVTLTLKSVNLWTLIESNTRNIRKEIKIAEKSRGKKIYTSKSKSNTKTEIKEEKKKKQTNINRK